MSRLLEINRDFPYQVALSFDEAPMDVFRTGSKSATSSGTCTLISRRTRSGTAFARRGTRLHSSGGSRMRRKGELSPAAIDRGWLDRVVLPSRGRNAGSDVWALNCAGKSLENWVRRALRHQ